MNNFGFVVQTGITFFGEDATPRAARPLARMAALQLVGIAGYSSSLRLVLHTKERTARDVQLPFLG